MVEAAASRHHMEVGVAALASRGSGGARLAVSAEAVQFTAELEQAGRRLSESLVARSSTLLEESGEWAGAFASYVDIAPEQLPRALVGCWASAFSVEALRHQEASGVTPGSFDMAVLVQPTISPRAGGTAEIADDGSVSVHAVAGPPAPLLQGWVAGQEARRPDGGDWEGPLLDLVTSGELDEVALALQGAAELLDVNRCEWAAGGEEVWILQFGRVPAPGPPPADHPHIPDELIPFARSVMSAPGKLGEELVLPWALAGLPPGSRHSVPDPTVGRARELCRRLTAQVWRLPPDQAMPRSSRFLADVEAGNFDAAALADLDAPDPQVAGELLAMVDGLREMMGEVGIPVQSAWHLSSDDIERVLAGQSHRPPARMGTGRWEPLVAATVLAHGARRKGTPAAPGIGAGVRAHVSGPETLRAGGPRRVVTAPRAVPNLSQLLWDAAGLVTRAGGPAAHLFQSARSLGIPAVCGVDPGIEEDLIVAVDGYTGVVATLPLHPVL